MGGRSPAWATAAGALIGTLPLFAFGGVDEPYLPIFGVVLGWIPQAAFATIGFTAGESGAR
jgi:Flp pilus assembly protein protease CpaA